MANKNLVTTATAYKNVMAKIDALMEKGSNKLTKEELKQVRLLAQSAHEYEQKVYKIDMPKTLAGMIEMKMFEMKIKQKDLAKKLKVSDAKLSLIMNGKQKPDLQFIKNVHMMLNVDANFILEHI